MEENPGGGARFVIEVPVYQPAPVSYEPPVHAAPSPYGTAASGHCEAVSGGRAMACLEADGTWRVVD